MSSTGFDPSFNPFEYLNTYYTNPNEMTYGYQQLTNFWNQHDGKDLRVLEYGGGPVVSRLVSACPHVKEFVFADYLEANREAVQAWIDKDPKAFDWRPTLEFIVQELEGKGPDEVVRREDELREKIQAIVPCDIRAEKILDVPLDLEDKYGPPYDVVATAFCPEVVVKNRQEYESAWKKLVKLVKPGGYLLMQGDLDLTYYNIAYKKHYCFTLTRELVKESMKEAGIKGVQIDFTTNRGFIEEEKSGILETNDEFFAVCRV